MRSLLAARPSPILAALVAALAFVPAAHAQKTTPPPAKPAQEAAKEQKKLVEAEALGEAYILLAGANHDYDGHRAKAMHQVHEAIKILDAGILKKGTPVQKAMAAQEERALAAAKEGAKAAPKVHENQKASDDQLRAAAKLLLEVRGVLAANKQVKPLEHVDNAIKQIDIALKVR